MPPQAAAYSRPLESSWARDTSVESESSWPLGPPCLPRPQGPVRTEASLSPGRTLSRSREWAGLRGREDAPALTFPVMSRALRRRSHGGHPQRRGLAGGPRGGQ